MSGQTKEFYPREVLCKDDLTINCDGHLSEAQRNSLCLSVLFWFGIAGLNVGVLFFLIYVQLRYQIEGYGYILLCVVPIMAAGYCVVYTAPFWKDIKSGEVKSVTGKAFKRWNTNTPSNGRSTVGHCTVRVGYEVFTVSPYLYDWIRNEGFYRVYFAPNTKKVINIESL